MKGKYKGNDRKVYGKWEKSVREMREKCKGNERKSIREMREKVEGKWERNYNGNGRKKIKLRKERRNGPKRKERGREIIDRRN